MFQLLIKKLAYGVLVLAGVVVVVFFVFQAFGDPARMVLGQTGDKKTMDNIRKELYLDQPKWKQFVFYINDSDARYPFFGNSICNPTLDRNVLLGVNRLAGSGEEQCKYYQHCYVPFIHGTKILMFSEYSYLVNRW